MRDDHPGGEHGHHGDHGDHGGLAAGRCAVRVLLADDHPLFRAGLRTLLGTDPRVETIGEAEDGPQTVALALSLRPDVVVMDLQMPELDGVEATRRILDEAPDIGILVLTMADDDEAVIAALRAGARGYLLKEAGPAEVLAAVVSVGEGATVFGPGVARRITSLLAAPPTTASAPFPELTDREREVLELIARGHSNPVIARQLVLSPKTVRNHISSIFAKLQVQARAEAIVRARRAGLGR
jgi:DNA-binding NarL/FixJ family response regulator